MPRPNYIEYRLGSQSAYVRADKLREIREVDVIVFDCDGVLIDVSESIRRAKGYVGKGRVLIADKALDWLETLIGGPRFGISLREPRRHGSMRPRRHLGSVRPRRPGLARRSRGGGEENRGEPTQAQPLSVAQGF